MTKWGVQQLNAGGLSASSTDQRQCRQVPVQSQSASPSVQCRVRLSSTSQKQVPLLNKQGFKTFLELLQRLRRVGPRAYAHPSMTDVLSALGGLQAACPHSHTQLRRLPGPILVPCRHIRPSAARCDSRKSLSGRRRDSHSNSHKQHGPSRLPLSPQQPLNERCRAPCAATPVGIGVGSNASTVDQLVSLPRAAGSSLPARALYGSILGLVGAAIILTGGWVYTAATCLVVYQACQEFQGFLSSKGISGGMEPPAPIVNALTSLLCVGFTLFAHLSNGKSTAALAVTSFAVLSLQLVAVKKVHFSQLTSAVFGLFYCGEAPDVARMWPLPPTQPLVTLKQAGTIAAA